MKKLKRRLSAAFRHVSLSSSTIVVNDNDGDNDAVVLSAPTYRTSQLHNSQSMPPGYLLRASTTTLSDSMSELALRLAEDGIIVEECDNNGVANLVHMTQNGGCCDRSLRYDSRFRHNGGAGYYSSSRADVHPEPTSANASSVVQVLLRAKKNKRMLQDPPKPYRTNSWHSNHRMYNGSGYHGYERAVVHEGCALGSDGESVDASPCTSDDVATSTTVADRYVVNVKMRPKPTRRWSEQDIQKRLSLPADLRLPIAVIEKLNRTPTLDQPLTRKSRRASLSEIGFGKLETYQKLEKLGEGTYATVYKGRSRLTDNFVALKEIRLEQEEGAPCTAIREVSLLRELRHANVVTLHDIIHTERLLTLVFEYVDRDLKQYMDECANIMSISNARIFLFQLLRGLAYCHKHRVLHRDLKPQNLLINEKGELKLADFGLARAKSVPTKTYSHEVVTLWYRPPDILLGATNYSTHIDMWGVGCILFEMSTGRPMFPGSSAEEELHLIFRALGTPRPDRHPTLCASADFKSYGFPKYYIEPLVNHAPRLDSDGIELLSQFLQYEGRKRILAQDAMVQKFFRSLPPGVLQLQDNESVLSVPGVHLSRDPGTRNNQIHNNNHHHRNQHAIRTKSRRQSLLL